MLKLTQIIFIISISYSFSINCQEPNKNIASVPDSLRSINLDAVFNFYVDPAQSTLIDPYKNPSIIPDGGCITDENLCYSVNTMDEFEEIDLTVLIANLRNFVESAIFESCSVFIGRVSDEPFYEWDREIKFKKDKPVRLSLQSLSKILNALDQKQEAGLLYEVITPEGNILRAVLVPEL